MWQPTVESLSKCAAENKPTAKFCEECGTALTGYAASAVPSSAQAASRGPNIRVTPEQPAGTPLEGERKTPEGFDKNTFPQLSYGKFYTSVSLPAGLDLDKLNCRLHDGVLDIQVPVAEQMKPRQVQINTGEPQQQQRKGISA